jgi:hypothetical protein
VEFWQTCGVHLTERELLDRARQQLVALLPSYIEVSEPSYDQYVAGTGGDAIWVLRAKNSGYGQLLVEARSSFQPKDVE